ncbi:hypothetical protein BJ508DRAFT_412684 [Ascobolus immersus RN42]|uniref:Uncharacterized protein n=1 Tax=Ascobolus immersus RN42 TaxID=1160509 RepID=A0A3N4IIU6_ASCIM|nr:hypothetical protein BJ508DRAFT_412684 [Ascobolus immersus RN42]
MIRLPTASATAAARSVSRAAQTLSASSRLSRNLPSRATSFLRQHGFRFLSVGSSVRIGEETAKVTVPSPPGWYFRDQTVETPQGSNTDPESQTSQSQRDPTKIFDDELARHTVWDTQPLRNSDAIRITDRPQLRIGDDFEASPRKAEGLGKIWPTEPSNQGLGTLHPNRGGFPLKVGETPSFADNSVLRHSEYDAVYIPTFASEPLSRKRLFLSKWKTTSMSFRKQASESLRILSVMIHNPPFPTPLGFDRQLARLAWRQIRSHLSGIERDERILMERFGNSGSVLSETYVEVGIMKLAEGSHKIYLDSKICMEVIDIVLGRKAWKDLDVGLRPWAVRLLGKDFCASVPELVGENGPMKGPNLHLSYLVPRPWDQSSRTDLSGIESADVELTAGVEEKAGYYTESEVVRDILHPVEGESEGTVGSCDAAVELQRDSLNAQVETWSEVGGKDEQSGPTEDIHKDDFSDEVKIVKVKGIETYWQVRTTVGSSKPYYTKRAARRLRDFILRKSDMGEDFTEFLSWKVDHGKEEVVEDESGERGQIVKESAFVDSSAREEIEENDTTQQEVLQRKFFAENPQLVEDLRIMLATKYPFYQNITTRMVEDLVIENTWRDGGNSAGAFFEVLVELEAWPQIQQTGLRYNTGRPYTFLRARDLRCGQGERLTDGIIGYIDPEVKPSRKYEGLAGTIHVDAIIEAKVGRYNALFYNDSTNMADEIRSKRDRALYTIGGHIWDSRYESKSVVSSRADCADRASRAREIWIKRFVYKNSHNTNGKKLSTGGQLVTDAIRMMPHKVIQYQGKPYAVETDFSKLQFIILRPRNEPLGLQPSRSPFRADVRRFDNDRGFLPLTVIRTSAEMADIQAAYLDTFAAVQKWKGFDLVDRTNREWKDVYGHSESQQEDRKELTDTTSLSTTHEPPRFSGPVRSQKAITSQSGFPSLTKLPATPTHVAFYETYTFHFGSLHNSWTSPDATCTRIRTGAPPAPPVPTGSSRTTNPVAPASASPFFYCESFNIETLPTELVHLLGGLLEKKEKAEGGSWIVVAVRLVPRKAFSVTLVQSEYKKPQVFY